MVIDMKDDFYYEPNVKKRVYPQDCLDLDEYSALIKQISVDDRLTSVQKVFLKHLASRFIVAKYEKLADLYSQSDKVMQEWLEKLHCVIVDTDSAIKNGYFKYMKDYSKLLEDVVNE